VKPGDIVQQGSRVLRMSKDGRPIAPSSMRGIVIAIRELPHHMKNSRNGDWSKLLGRTVDVFWFNGRFQRNFAENSLEVVKDS
jgi:hypothetical protein